MTPFIRKVTVTGVDEFVNRDALKEVQNRFPFVEWGVLYSTSKSGTDNRYPSLDWIKELEYFDLSLSCHLCGSVARDVAEGGRAFLDLMDKQVLMFSRVQLNISHIVNTVDHDKLEKGLKQFIAMNIVPIVQVKPTPLWDALLMNVIHDINVLYDCSGGRGILPDYWPVPAHMGSLLPVYGYAGGLNPDNLAKQLPLMQQAASGMPVWIDVESGVRTGVGVNEVFDLQKVELFLEAARPYVTPWG